MFRVKFEKRQEDDYSGNNGIGIVLQEFVPGEDGWPEHKRDLFRTARILQKSDDIELMKNQLRKDLSVMIRGIADEIREIPEVM